MSDAMNASPHHPKVKVSLMVADQIFVAGAFVSGKMEMECRADRGLGINNMMVELFAIQELTSRDHSATSTFLHSRRVFQGPGLPPSNAVQAFPTPNDPPLPRNYYQARRGVSTFLFRFPLPSSSPSSLSFGGGLARVRYELRAAVEVFWKGEKRLVTDTREVDVVEIFEEDFMRVEPEGVVVGENGKMWVQGRVVGGLMVAGESACVELLVKNHSARRNSSLTITLSRNLHLPGYPSSQKPPLEISDTLTTVSFRGPEYIIAPGVEGIASLVFDVPKHARGVKGGMREGDESEARQTEALFEVRCVVGIKIGMGIGSKDVHLDLPISIVHPLAAPERFYASPTAPDLTQAPVMSPAPHPDLSCPPCGYPAPPPFQPYLDQGQVWFPPPMAMPTHPYPPFSPQPQGEAYYLPPPAPLAYPITQRSSSAGPSTGYMPLGLPVANPNPLSADEQMEREEGKGKRALRVTHHLRQTSRHRSVSPPSHRFPAQATLDVPTQVQAVVHSPRPVISPKRSFSIDPRTHETVSKSERVQVLEQMADEVVPAEIGQETTSRPPLHPLPVPDVPAPAVMRSPQPVLSPTRSLSTRLRTPETASKSERVEALERMADELVEQPAAVDKTLPAPPVPDRSPPTKAAAVFASHDVTPPTPLNAVTPVRVNGLDALERRLVAEVGTVRPIMIPPPRTARDEPPLDSAISSLTLADHWCEPDSDERTHKPPKSNVSVGQEPEGGKEKKEKRKKKEKRREAEGEGEVQERKKERGKDKEKRRENEGEKEGRKKDRYKDKDLYNHRKTAQGRVAAWLGTVDPHAVPEDVPPPPMPVEAPPPPPVPGEGSPSRPLQVEGLPSPPLQLEGAPTPPTRTEDAPNPRSSGFLPVGTFRRDPFFVPVYRKHILAQEKLMPKPPVRPPDPEVKYDVRSARGGRGGKVTAVAALWASHAAADVQTKPKPKASSPQDQRTRHARVAAESGEKRVRKTECLPALLSSSPATPTLYTSASLARPETQTQELAFGKARLRDLIRKYQGQ